MNTLSKYLSIALAVLLIILGLSCARSCDLKHQSNNWKHNYEVLQDSMEVIETKNGELLFENGSLILEKNELEDALDITKQQVKDYEKALGSKLAYISKLEAELAVKDTLTITEVVHDTLANSYLMHYADKWLKFDESFSLKNPYDPIMKVFNIKMDVPLKVGIGDNYRIFVTSDNPYFNVTSIEGAVIDGSQFAKKQPRWSFGIYGGFGLNYDIIHKTFGAGPQIGAGIGYRFF